jgi:hypothetical protein
MNVGGQSPERFTIGLKTHGILLLDPQNQSQLCGKEKNVSLAGDRTLIRRFYSL